MSFMFYKSKKFKCDLSRWNTVNLIFKGRMFEKSNFTSNYLLLPFGYRKIPDWYIE